MTAAGSGQGSGGHFMGPSDAWIWYLEGDPRMRWTISAVMLLDQAPDWDRLVSRFERVSRIDPRFRQKVVEPPMRAAPPRWTVDEWFDLAYHVRRVAAPPPGSLADVLAFAGTSAMAGLDRDRPLWEATLMEGLEGGQAALVVKMHHSLTDGIGGLQLALHLVDPTPGVDPDDPGPPPLAPEHLGATGMWKEVGRHHVDRLLRLAGGMAHAALPTAGRMLTDPVGLAKDVGAMTASVAKAVRPISDTKSTVMTERSLTWHYEVFDVPFARLRAGAKVAGCTVNDAFVAGLTGGMRRYHEQHGAPVDELRMSMPISLRLDGDPEGGNRVTVMRFAVPVGEADPVARLRKVHQAADTARHEPAVPHFDAITTGLAPITPLAVAPMATHMDFTASNVPGYSFPVHLCGSEVLRVYPFGPTGGASANATMITYRDTCCIGVNADTAAIPDMPAFMTCLAEGFDEVLALAEP
jgi:diacylglycerol O-acyltransferase / wax synthase